MTKHEKSEVTFLLEAKMYLTKEERVTLKAVEALGEDNQDKSLLRATWYKLRREGKL